MELSGHSTSSVTLEQHMWVDMECCTIAVAPASPKKLLKQAQDRILQPESLRSEGVSARSV